MSTAAVEKWKAFFFRVEGKVGVASCKAVDARSLEMDTGAIN